MLAVMRSNAVEIEGQVMYPHSYGEYSGVQGQAVPAPGQPQWFDYSVSCTHVTQTQTRT